MIPGDLPLLLTPSEVARRFGVSAKTVQRWASEGRLDTVRTPGGHRRYSEADVAALQRRLAERHEHRDVPTDPAPGSFRSWTSQR